METSSPFRWIGARLDNFSLFALLQMVSQVFCLPLYIHSSSPL